MEIVVGTLSRPSSLSRIDIVVLYVEVVITGSIRVYIWLWGRERGGLMPVCRG
jgi:hypothetical protein